MLKIEDNWETVGWQHAIRGMRNPMNSWEWSDSYFNDGEGNFFNILGGKLPPWPEPYADILIGPNDHDLMMNLRNAGNIGSESSAADNAFMYSVIESCKHNEIDPGKYISYLLGKLKTAHEGEDLTALLPCYCSL